MAPPYARLTSISDSGRLRVSQTLTPSMSIKSVRTGSCPTTSESPAIQLIICGRGAHILTECLEAPCHVYTAIVYWTIDHHRVNN